LFPGRPERGQIAIVLPLASHLWDSQTDSIPKYYEADAKGLHYALVHAGYTVDFVDDTDLEKPGEFAFRGYTTLYITGPNMSLTAQEKVSEWVNTQDASGFYGPQ
jgi:hypothetical protein